MSNYSKDQTDDTMTSEGAWSVYSPNVDVYESDAELLLVAEVPGAVAERTSVSLADSILSISAELPRVDGVSARYRRQFKLGVPVNADHVSAELRSGELTIRLTKADSHRPKRIDVRAS